MYGDEIYLCNKAIVLMYANARTKKGGILGKIYPTDLQKDLETIKELYAQYDIDVKIN
ncbi:acyltransferase [Acinetobacter baumannii]|nr:acyltransferase [Acinetobacter baumannii]